MTDSFDAVIVGSGPNGLSAGILLAQNGLRVLILEAKSSIGGGTRTQELTEPGFLHDVCSAVHPTAVASPFLKTLPLNEFGLDWCYPNFPVAHPLDDGQAVVVTKSLEETIQRLGSDGKAYARMVRPLVERWDELSPDFFAPIRIPKKPVQLAKFGMLGMHSAVKLAKRFKEASTRGFFAGLAAHSILPLENRFTASFGLIFSATIHAANWPIVKGGSASITHAMAAYFKSLGGMIEVNTEITDFKQIPSTKSVLFDLTPHQIARIADSEFPYRFTKKLMDYQYGPGVFKIDFALSGPVPWANQECELAGTLHLGGTIGEIAASERACWKGQISGNPYVIVSQPSIFDETRAPKGKHTLWAYCHVPHGSHVDQSEAIIKQIERFAPAFRETIISYSTMTSPQIQEYNANYIGGDINGGAQYFRQIIGRPVLKWDPYKLRGKRMYICSSSTPPGGGVHGMSGYHAARSVLKNEFGIT